MNTLKSAAVILVLAGVLYGVYTALNAPPSVPPPGMTAKDVDEMAPPEIDFSTVGGSESAGNLPAPPSTLSLSSAGTSPASLPEDAEEETPETSIYGPAGPAVEAAPSTSVPTGTAAAAPPASSYNQQSNFETPAKENFIPASSGSGLSGSDSPPTSPVASAAPGSSLAGFAFRRDAQQAERLVSDGKFRSALALLSPYYGNAELADDQRQQLVAWLDALAAKVIYSREHLLDLPHVVRGQESLFDLSQRLHVPAELLQNINGINDPRVLLPGTELKVVPGPFRAEVHLVAGEITLFLGDLYAGRFPLSLGNEPPQPAEYTVHDKRSDRTYIGADGRTIAANDPTNPYGQAWIDLGPTACIHGSPQSSAPDTQTLGCISLSPQDARDLYSILSVGSKVAVLR
ncbi:MAG: L,D-transpeptidase family protein [Pirellulaceae bacterium]